MKAKRYACAIAVVGLTWRKCLRRDPADRYPNAGPLLTEVERLTTASGAGMAGATPDGDQASLWWWQMLQAMLAAVIAGMPVACWFLRGGDRSVGSKIFRRPGDASVTIRLNLLFTARVHPAHLAGHRRRLHLPMAAVELCLGGDPDRVGDGGGGPVRCAGRGAGDAGGGDGGVAGGHRAGDNAGAGAGVRGGGTRRWLVAGACNQRYLQLWSGAA